jgi:galactokinase
VLGAFLVLKAERNWRPPHGVSLQFDSEVPHGAGVSSSAALEVATLFALNRVYALELSGHAIALLAQKVENHVALAPCGVMDQLSVSLGLSGHLLRLRCQPDQVEGFVVPPEGFEFWGIDSGAKHSVGDGAYSIARCGAFMGREIVRSFAPGILKGTDGESYLANIPAAVWRAIRERVPETLSGADFLARYGSHGDSVTEVEPARIYPVRLNAEHPVYEADRVQKFADFLRLASENPQARQEFGRAAGELMVQSHFSYDHRCNLGSKETDLLVQLARQAGIGQGVYGAKITGGGSGGTVALLADRQLNPNVEATIEAIASEYSRQTGIAPHIFSGTSDGAVYNM